jgi:hypothetical protein
MFLSAPTPAPRRFDAHSFPRTESYAGLSGDFFFSPVTPNNHSASASAVGSARQAVGSARTAVGEQSDLGVGQDLDFADNSVAAVVQARASTVGAKRILPQRIGYAYSRASAGVLSEFVM